MKTISLKLEDTIFEETCKVVDHIHISRNRYINEALEYYNTIQSRKLLEARLEQESKLVSHESMKVLHEFEAIDHAG